MAKNTETAKTDIETEALLLPEPEPEPSPPSLEACSVCGKSTPDHSDAELNECLSKLKKIPRDQDPLKRISHAMQVASSLKLPLEYHQDGQKHYVRIGSEEWICSVFPARRACELILRRR